jgi:NTE family protein
MKHTFGITLSGGGIKGLLHAGVLQALEENNLKPTCISGASAGAMVGVLYASGIKPDKILEIVHNLKLFSFKSFNLKEPGFFGISPLKEQLEKYIEAKTFEELPIEFHTVATNLVEGKSKLFSSGDLVPAVLASSAFPMVFSPVDINGHLYADGGITNNFPVDAIRDRCKYLLGVYASPLHEIKEQKLSNSVKVADRVYHIAVNYSSSLKFGTCDKVINPKGLEKYGTFEMNKADKIFEIGYNAANDSINQIKNDISDLELNPIQLFFRKF